VDRAWARWTPWCHRGVAAYLLHPRCASRELDSGVKLGDDNIDGGRWRQALCGGCKRRYSAAGAAAR